MATEAEQKEFTRLKLVLSIDNFLCGNGGWRWLREIERYHAASYSPEQIAEVIAQMEKEGRINVRDGQRGAKQVWMNDLSFYSSPVSLQLRLGQREQNRQLNRVEELLKKQEV
jgi:hypothetical protein